MGKKMTALSILSSAPVTAIALALIFGFYSPIGTGILTNMQSALLGILFLSVVPTLTILHFYRRGVVDIELSERRLRTPFYAIAIGSQMIAAIVFYSLSDTIMFVTAMAYAMATAIIMFINLKWKISAHAAGIAGPVTALFAVFGEWTLPLYLLLVPVFAQRIKVRAHNIWQLIGGTVVATVVTYAVYKLML